MRETSTAAPLPLGHAGFTPYPHPLPYSGSWQDVRIMGPIGLTITSGPEQVRRQLLRRRSRLKAERRR